MICSGYLKNGLRCTYKAFGSLTTCRIHIDKPEPQGGARSLYNGKKYEDQIKEYLETQNMRVLKGTGGASTRPDVSFWVSNRQINIECKNKGSFEGGGKRFVVQHQKLVIPEDGLHKYLIGSHVPFGSRVPSFLDGDRTLETWTSEKHLFTDEYLAIPDDTMRNYYRNIGIHYIQIEGKGLYSTCCDTLGLGAPPFSCKTRMRIRCKRHTGSPMPGSVQASIVFDRKTLTNSPVDISKSHLNVLMNSFHKTI